MQRPNQTQRGERVQKIKDSRVFITGGAGFIGSNLVKKLIGANEVFIFDNLHRNAMQYILKDAKREPKIFKGDILDYSALNAAMTEADPHYIVHCAAIAGIDTVAKRPVSTLEINMLGTANTLRAANNLKHLKRIVTFSTSEIFGPHAYNSNERSASVIGATGEARWSYAVSKLAGEHLTIAYHSQFGMPGVVLRPFNVYGPGQVGEGALSTFIQRAINHEEIQIHGDGNQIRAWCYIEDMCSAVLAGLTHDGATGKAFNIGNPRAVTTIYGLASTVIRLLESKSKIRFVRKDYADIELRVPDPTWARTEMDFAAKYDLEEGIPLTAEFYREIAKK